MAKWEIHKRTLDIRSNIWWKLMPGTIIEVRWPVGPVGVPNGDNSGMLTESADPNDHFRPWLEKNVGKQGWHWDWRIAGIAASNGQGTIGVDTLAIKFVKSKEAMATLAKLMWS